VSQNAHHYLVGGGADALMSSHGNSQGRKNQSKHRNELLESHCEFSKWFDKSEDSAMYDSLDTV
jgi:hypothetical protein